ncbi:MAG: hypothetical protein GAK43_02151 [Stenotrophomonas maltophilia]|nr:MAG: hypothetical protein GAK43_02151 [Stenotrophomonas maltophilia]
MPAGFQPVVAQVEQLLAQQFFVFVVDQEEVVQQRAQPLGPFGRVGFTGKHRAGVVQRLQQPGQRAQGSGVQAADFGVGLNALVGLALAHREAQQHAPQTESPAVGFSGGRQAEALALATIEAPAHPGAVDPATQQRQVGIGQAETRAHGSNVEQVEDFADREAAVGQP